MPPTCSRQPLWRMTSLKTLHPKRKCWVWWNRAQRSITMNSIKFRLLTGPHKWGKAQQITSSKDKENHWLESFDYHYRFLSIKWIHLPHAKGQKPRVFVIDSKIGAIFKYQPYNVKHMKWKPTKIGIHAQKCDCQLHPNLGVVGHIAYRKPKTEIVL